MNPRRQLNLLRKIWGRNTKGYVFLPFIEAKHARDKATRKQHWREPKAFRWPDDAVKIEAHLEKHADDDLYFTPMVFAEPRRKTEYATASTSLWADLDEKDPETLPERLKPTHAWETSPGRFAAVWTLSEPREGASLVGGVNHRLTTHIGADQSGWDTTQLLRVPGSANNKPGKPAGTRGSVVWANREIHEWDAYDALPEVKAFRGIAPESLTEEAIDALDADATWQRYRLKCGNRVRQYMRMQDDGGLDRSSVVWQVERDLADAGASLAEIIAVVRPSPWNKFDGRNDELTRLITEAAKAIAAKKETTVTEDNDGIEVLGDEDGDEEMPLPLTGFGMYDLPAPTRTRWLVRDILPAGAVGFMAGPPKSMKSWFALYLLVCITHREKFIDHSIVGGGNALYIQQEDDDPITRHRLGIILDSINRKHHFSGYLTVAYDVEGNAEITWHAPKRAPFTLHLVIQKGFNAASKSWQKWLHEYIRANDIVAVVADTLSTVSGGRDVDKAQEIKGEVLDPIKAIARDTGCSITFVHHNTKGAQNKRGAMNMAGSGQIHAWADWGLYFREREGSNLELEVETKSGSNRVFHVRIPGLDIERPDDIEKDAGTASVVWNPEEYVPDLDEDHTKEPTKESTRRGKRNPRTGDFRKARQKQADKNKAAGDANREKVRKYKQEHPDASIRAIGEAVGLSKSAVSDHLRRIREELSDPEELLASDA